MAQNYETLLVTKEAGITTLKDILKSSAEDLMKIQGIGPKTAEKIITAAHRAILNKDKAKELPKPS